ALNRMVMFVSDAMGETWTFDGKRWTLVDTNGPRYHTVSAYAYDPLSKTILLFGGVCNMAPCPGNDMWSWDGKSWTQLHPASTPPPGFAAMVFDAATKQMILLASNGTTWTWDETRWTELQIPSPPIGTYATLVYDSAHKQVLLWEGGVGYEGGSQTWIYKAGGWTQVAGPEVIASAPPATAPPTLIPASGARLESPPPGAICRVPYADISEATGGWMSYPGGGIQPDPAATVALPGNTPGQIGVNPGLTFIPQNRHWVPVPYDWVAPSGRLYADLDFNAHKSR